MELALSAQTCANCYGLWIASTDYWAWLDQLPGGGAVAGLPEDAPEMVDVPKAKRCPGCSYLQLGYRITLDLDFALDQCGHCNINVLANQRRSPEGGRLVA
jgi:hypothetical protein